jgi:hypothetical protein
MERTGVIAQRFAALRGAFDKEAAARKERLEAVLLVRIRTLVQEWLDRDARKMQWSHRGTRCLMDTLELSVPPQGWIGMLVGNQYVGGRHVEQYLSVQEPKQRDWLCALFAHVVREEFGSSLDGFQLHFERPMLLGDTEKCTDVWIEELHRDV